MYVKVTVTAEDEETASDVTLSKVAENEDFGVIEITSAEVIAANSIAITLANPVITTDTTITVTKGTDTIAVTASWAETFDFVTLTAPTNLSEGEYTVTLTSTEDPTNTDSADFTVEGQKVAEIVILNSTALTNPDDDVRLAHTRAYAYYDVLDQYGESIRTSASIQWSSSAHVAKTNKATGEIVLTKNEEGTDAWVYNDKIYLTGVYTKTGVATTAELTVGTEQALNKIEPVGFVRKNTSVLKSNLPADFKSGEWYLLFNAYDQNGNLMDPAASALADTDVTFVSDNVLVVKEVKGVNKDGLITVGDVEYNTVLVAPGLKVADGGLVNVTAIATKTGEKTEYPFLVTEDPVIVSFTIGAPTATLADGESIEIPFTAVDEDGNTVTDFDTIAKQQTFNALTLNVGGNGWLTLDEQNDGSAVLTYHDATMPWTESEATDGIDRPVSLTAVVLGGASDNQMISISDKARPDAINAVNLDDVYVEGATITLGIDDISFYDQYGREMGTYGKDNGFFGATAYNGSSEFKGYNFSVRATYSGNGGLYVDVDGHGIDPDTGEIKPYNPIKDFTLTTNSGWILQNGVTIPADIEFGGVPTLCPAEVVTKEDVLKSKTNEGFKFDIVKVKTSEKSDPEKYDSASRSKSKFFTVVDINSVKNFTIGELGTLYVGADAAEPTITGDGKIKSGMLEGEGKLHGDALVAFGGTPATVTATGGLTDTEDYQKPVEVTGTYNGSTVTIPADYFEATGKKVFAKYDAGEDANIITGLIPYEVVDDVANGGLTIQDLYDKTTSEGVSKLASDTIVATVKGIYSLKAQPGDALDAEIGATKIATLKSSADFEAVAATPSAITVDKQVKDYGTTYTTASEAINARLEALATAAYNPEAYVKAGVWDLSAEAADAKLAEIDALNDVLKAIDAMINPEDVDTASIGVTLSDQAPTPYAFDGLADSYTLTPLTTVISDTNVNAELEDVTVVDQYGVTLATIDEISRKAASIVENEDGYVEGNFTTTKNNTTDMTINGAELGDTFVLGLSYKGLEASTDITVGADASASISSVFGNLYRDVLLEELEEQRKGIYGI